MRCLWWLIALELVAGCTTTPRHEGPVEATHAENDHLPLPSLAGAVGWKAGEVAPESLAGHVTVVAFLSFDLPRSLRVLPTLIAWNDAYARYGVRVLGVHVPAFAFAADSAASARAARRLGIRFPVALDPSLQVWRAFDARGATPRIVVAGPDGRVALDREAIGALPDIERTIRALVLRAHPELRFPSGEPAASSLVAEHAAVQLGQARVERGPLVGAVPGHAASFTAQLRYQVEGEPYTAYPVGRWMPAADGLTAARGGAENFVALRYDSGALGAVLGPPESKPARVWILRDERWLTRAEAGADVQFDGRGASYVMVSEPRLYALTRAGRGSHVVKLSPDEPGTTIYAITFEPFESSEPRP